ncbi:phage tail domain-containing protein [Staphylococcus nepalensis]
MKKEVELIFDNETIKLTNNEGFVYMDFLEDDVQVQDNNIEINGVDGVLPGAITFAPFNLELRFIYSGIDTEDYRLFKSKLRSIIYQRKPYYVWHSDMPGKKYAVLPQNTEIEDKFGRNGEIILKFLVWKGYSESLKDTSQFSLSSGDWQFEAVARADDSIKYTHTSDYFDIYNGSSDTIDPLLRHKLQIQIKADAPNGITIRNLTTEDKFVYNKPLTPSKTLTIQGVHPLLDGNRVGIDTNWQWITLAPGYNAIKIEDDSIISVETKWSFNFIYR